MRELEHKSFYYNELSGLHKPQTLDESYYDMLPEEDLRIRDRDQVVFKWFMRVICKEKQIVCCFLRRSFTRLSILRWHRKC